MRPEWAKGVSDVSKSDSNDAPGRPFTKFQLDLLCAVADVSHSDSQQSGRDIKEAVGRIIDDDEINDQRVYDNLTLLAESGLVSKDPVNNRRNAYTLTAEGAREITQRAGQFATAREKLEVVSE